MNIPTVVKSAQHLEAFSNKLFSRCELNGECLEWRRARDYDGYGICWANGFHWRAHRLAWTLWVGPIPNGLSVLHRCDNPPCCLPEHLFLGTAKDNLRDAVVKGRWRAPQGTEQDSAKLNAEKVREIRNRYSWRNKTGNNMYALAREFEVNVVTIWAIIHHRKWTHVL